MKWENLKKNKCPQCNKDLLKGMGSEVIRGSSGREFGRTITHPCGFKISDRKFNEIVSGMVCDQLERNAPKEELSKCCGASMVHGGIQCETCGGPGF